MATLVYLCDTPDNPASRQRDAIRGHLARLGQFASAEFLDGPDVRFDPWESRPAARDLLSVAKAGDVVVCAAWVTTFGSTATMSGTLDRMAAAGVEIRWVQEGITVPAAGPFGDAIREVVRTAVTIERSIRSEAVRYALRRRWASGRQYCRHAPYGFRWVGPKGKRRLKALPEEQQVIEQVRAWRRGGLTYHAISLRLRAERRLTPAGRPWSVDRVRRVCEAAGVPA